MRGDAAGEGITGQLTGRETMSAKDSELPKISMDGFARRRRKLAIDERLPPRASFVEELLALSATLRTRKERRPRGDGLSSEDNSMIKGKAADDAHPRRPDLRA